MLRGALALLAIAFLPRALRADPWPEPAFESTASGEALIELFGTDRTLPSDAIALQAPLVAENGRVVPVTVATDLDGVRSIHLLVERNPRPLAASFKLGEGMLPEIACRIKMAETSPVLAVVETPQGLFSASATVKVTLGGCA